MTTTPRIDIRQLGYAEREEFLHHLMRLDGTSRAQRFAAGVDDHFVLSHCLTRVLGHTLIVGALADGTVRGACEIDIDPDHHTAELAFTVEKPLRGMGIGQRLMHGATDACRDLGLARLRLDVSARNTAMRRICEKAGARFEGGRSTLTYHVVLDPARADWQGHAAHCREPRADDLLFGYI